MRAAHAIASSREGSSSTVKPPLSGGAHEYPPAENVPSAETSTGGTASSIPPPKTYTPAALLRRLPRVRRDQPPPIRHRVRPSLRLEMRLGISPQNSFFRNGRQSCAKFFAE